MGSRSIYRVAVAGMDVRDVRLVEILFRHSPHNAFAYELVEANGSTPPDILIVAPSHPDGARTLAAFRDRGWTVPAVVVSAASGEGPQAERDAQAGGYTLALAHLIVRLLPLLNRVVALECAPSAAGAPTTPLARVPSAAAPGSIAPAPIAVARDRAPGVPVAPAPIHLAPAGPDAPRPLPAPSVPAQPAAAPAESGRAVLVVDDSATVRTQVVAAFNAGGWVTASAESAQQALERLAAQDFDLLIVDVGLPDLDGLKLARRVRSEPRWRAMPVIALTSRSSAIDVARGALAGCSAYLTKPIPVADLQWVAFEALRKAQAAVRPDGAWPRNDAMQIVHAGADADRLRAARPWPSGQQPTPG